MPEKSLEQASKMTISDCIKFISSISRVPGPTWIAATKRKAPCKPLLLLVVLDLVHRGFITAPLINVTGDLVEHNELVQR